VGDLLGEDAAWESKHILCRCLGSILNRKAAFFRHLKSRWQDLFDIKLQCQRGMKKMKEA
jgi:hypothetical protein